MGFGFLDITLVDIIDIFVVALIMFQVYRLTRGTNALRIVVGILIIYLLWIVTRVLNMELLSMILGQIIGVGVIALIIVFQQEIRRFLILLGTQYTNRRVSFMARLFRPRGRKVKVVGQEWIDTVVGACADMAKTKTGALIVIARKVNLLPFIEQGERIDALISASLIKNIFFKNSPLHDGAMVIADDRIAAGAVRIAVHRARGSHGVRDAPPRGARRFRDNRCAGDRRIRRARNDLHRPQRTHQPRYLPGPPASAVAQGAFRLMHTD